LPGVSTQPEEQARTGFVPFGLPDENLEAAERYWAGRDPDAADMRRILGLPESGSQ